MDSWNRAIALIEEQIADGATHRSGGEIDVARLAQATLTSEHHFRRMFSVLAGMPVSEYVRRRRMTLAAPTVLGGREPLQDIAVRFGYSSADAFSRAFRTVHGVGPAEARGAGAGAGLRSQAPLRFTLTVEGTEQMNYRIETLDAFTLVGRSRRMSIVQQGPNPAMTEFLEELGRDVLEDISARSTRRPAGVLAVCTDFEEEREDGSTFDYWLAAATDGPTGDHHSLRVGAHRWLVLGSRSMEIEDIQQLWPQAYGEWFPSNPYEPVEAPELLATVFDADGGESHMELWLAVRETEQLEG
ncbi:AraC family transcriptional regulator [Nesterenkonia xinjiangensis]|uniref:AraC family transcriptional regulator n=1 Tax=Nesterenkonia xinjiangensis TaxID=225327 RepID=A0A7Z0GPI2_9MICC|nr:helix-turn-helix domain-containing protein [Nesterenkonia xinjiangensis]NYJ79737.1 AraC family transcriptional regulator [Nesterenkonia xinjiangensis]